LCPIHPRFSNTPELVPEAGHAHRERLQPLGLGAGLEHGAARASAPSGAGRPGSTPSRPRPNPDSFDVTEHYPRRFLSRDRKKGDLKEVAPIRAVFTLDEKDIEVIGDELGVVLPPSARVEAWRTYGGDLEARVRGDFAEILEIACNEAGVDHDEDRAALAEHTTVQDVVAAAAALVKDLTAKSPRGKNLAPANPGPVCFSGSNTCG
jgi:hypothetical protein